MKMCHMQRLTLILVLSLATSTLVTCQRRGGSNARRRHRPERLAASFSRSDRCSTQLGNGARHTLALSNDIVTRRGLSPQQATRRLSGNNLPAEQNSCSQEDTGACTSSAGSCSQFDKFRTPDGACNNRRNPQWGSAHTVFRRVLSPAYDNGVDSPRTLSQDGSTPLPSARLVSTTVHDTTESPSTRNSLFLMQWGQFLDHDITLTPVVKDGNGEALECCGTSNADCFPIDIPEGDEMLSTFPDGCMEFSRSQPATTQPCVLDVRQQLNQITSYIDASNVYGSTIEEQRELRRFQNGLLRSQENTFDSSKKDFLPNESGTSDCTTATGAATPCFRAGDIRVSEQIGLTSLHTIWMREHNRLVGELASINPQWNDERLFQEARRIVGALMQQITYEEFLPEVLGPSAMIKYGLQLLTSGAFFTGYSSTTNPGITNVFATAAFRFGHSLVANQLNRQLQIGGDALTVDLSDTYFKPESFTSSSRKGPDPLLLGLCDKSGENGDVHVVTELRDHLFETSDAAFGLDLVAMNIQRGRDHGLPGYNDWRNWCGLGRITSFNALRNILTDRALADKYESIYQSVDDIDLFTASLSERTVSGGVVGETFACILGRQFRDLRRGDRFWYENSRQAGSFTQAQLEELRKVKLSRVICDNADDITTIQQEVMLQPNTIKYLQMLHNASNDNYVI